MVALAGVVVALARPAWAQPAPCITDFSTAQDVVFAGGAVTFCDDRRKNKKSCFSTELATGKTTSAAVPTPGPVPAPASGATVDINGKTAKVCKPDGTSCKTLRPRAHVDHMLVMTGTANAAGTLAALVNTSEIETFDLKTGKRIAGFAAGQGSCTWVRFMSDDTLLVQNEECGGGAETSWLANRKGGRIAAVGGDKPIDAMTPVSLGATRAAFVSAAGDVVVVQDVKTGKVERRIAIGTATEGAKPELVGDAKQLAVVFGGERWGDIAVIDLATDKVTTHAAKRCPK